MTYIDQKSTKNDENEENDFSLYPAEKWGLGPIGRYGAHFFFKII